MCNTSLSVGIIGIYTVRYSDSTKNRHLVQKMLKIQPNKAILKVEVIFYDC